MPQLTRLVESSERQAVAAFTAFLISGALGDLPAAAKLSIDNYEGIVGVLVFAFALVLVHLNTVTSQPGSGFAGLAVGFTVLAGVLAFGDLATGLFNPALPVGLYLSKVSARPNHCPIVAHLPSSRSLPGHDGPPSPCRTSP